MRTIPVVADHNGVEHKKAVIQWLTDHGYDPLDLGTHSTAIVDYPDLCLRVCLDVVEGRAPWAVVVGGSGQGELVVCNKVPGIRAGGCQTEWMAEISRGNNDANVLVLGAKLIPIEAVAPILRAWTSTEFRGGVHARRVDRITEIERHYLRGIAGSPPRPPHP